MTFKVEAIYRFLEYYEVEVNVVSLMQELHMCKCVFCYEHVLLLQAKHGGWVFLANCQLMTSWLPKLEKIIQTLEKSNPSPEFRLWLSSVPNDKFPIGILQRSVKMTAEPPKVNLES